MLKVRSREAWSGVCPSPEESEEKRCFFQGFPPSWSLRAESRAGRTTRDTQDQLRASLGATHTCGTSLADDSMLMRVLGLFLIPTAAAAAAAKSLQSCPTLCDPIDGSPPGSTIPGILQARTLA